MSEEKPPHLEIVRGSRSTEPRVSPEQAKQLFMASPHLEWTTFAKSNGWRSARKPFDGFSDWQKEKRDILAREQAEGIAEALFSHQGRWHADVLKTLKEFPEASDAMMGIFKKRINDIIVVINEDEKQKTLSAQSGLQYQSKFDLIPTKELTSIANGIKAVTEAKHKSLMIDGWNIRVAEQFTDPKQFEAPTVEDQRWKVQLIGGKELTDTEMKELMKTYYDVPGQTIDAVAGDLETT